MTKKLIIFIPSIEEGGVEKNLFIIANYLVQKKLNIEVLSCNSNKSKYFNKKIKFIGPKSSFWQNKPRPIKYLVCIFFLFINLFKKRSNKLIFAFQANIYAILIAKILRSKIIVRANSAPSGWSHNIIKKNLRVSPRVIKRKLDKFDPKKSSGKFDKLNRFLNIKNSKFVKLEDGITKTILAMKK